MIPQELFPPELQTATVEEQLSYLLRRRNCIDQIMRSLERYQEERDRTLPKGQSSRRVAA